MDEQTKNNEQLKAELDLAQARLAELRSRAKAAAAEASRQYAAEIGRMEEQVKEIRRKMQGPGQSADSESWEKVKDGLLHAGEALRNIIRNRLDRL